MYDSSALQTVCTAECSNGTAGAFAAVSSGCVVARTGAGTYTVTLNGQAGSEHVDAAASRVVALATTALQGVSVVKTSDSVFTVTTWVGAGGPNAAADGTFDITVFRDPTVTT
jgi:hypothetical protein